MATLAEIDERIEALESQRANPVRRTGFSDGRSVELKSQSELEMALQRLRAERAELVAAAGRPRFTRATYWRGE